MMLRVPDAFSANYRDARAKFLNGAATLGLEITEHRHPLLGSQGEDLALDVALDAAGDGKKILLISSACHGVEGFCGSGVQSFLLADTEWRDKARSAGVSVAYLHALNPWGFSFLRRVTNEGVDLNRNFFQNTGQPPRNEAYAQLQELLLPRQWPPTAANRAGIDGYIAENGMRGFQQATSQGQYEFADGLFFGGAAPTWSNGAVRQVLRTLGAPAQHIAWIDLHTGLGPSGHGERIYAGPDDAATYARAAAWWGGEGQTPVTSIYNGSSASAYLTGLMWFAALEECPQAQVTGMALEYGTQEISVVLNALRADHWLWREFARVGPAAVDAELASSISREVLKAFYTDTDVWKGQIISQGRQAAFQAVDGLAAA